MGVRHHSPDLDAQEDLSPLRTLTGVKPPLLMVRVAVGGGGFLPRKKVSKIDI